MSIHDTSSSDTDAKQKVMMIPVRVFLADIESAVDNFIQRNPRKGSMVRNAYATILASLEGKWGKEMKVAVRKRRRGQLLSKRVLPWGVCTILCGVIAVLLLI